MKLVAGVDIGNATTETAIARIDGKNVTFLSSGITGTTGIKGTKQNIHGVFQSLKNALDKVGFEISDLDEVRINEAAPVIGDVAMETITETIITESTMIGHNPNTPGGIGIGVGISQRIDRLDTVNDSGDVIVVIPAEVSFEAAAALINRYNKIFNITGAIVQRDDGVLINNRLEKKIPIVDEVGMIDKVPLGMLCAVEVAPVGGVVEVLSNPYGIATLFKLSPEDTKQVVPIARALIGNRSAVVIKTPEGDVKERRIPAGSYNPQKIKGGLANEFSLESAVGIAAMVKADRLQMKMIAEELTDRLKIPVYVGGVEADMAIKGALTTPGTNVPLAIVDMGAGSTDASIKDRDGNVKLVHLAGAGNMVTLLIQSELGLEDFNTAEDIKK